MRLQYLLWIAVLSGCGEVGLVGESSAPNEPQEALSSNFSGSSDLLAGEGDDPTDSSSLNKSLNPKEDMGSGSAGDAAPNLESLESGTAPGEADPNAAWENLLSAANSNSGVNAGNSGALGRLLEESQGEIAGALDSENLGGVSEPFEMDIEAASALEVTGEELAESAELSDSQVASSNTGNSQNSESLPTSQIPFEESTDLSQTVNEPEPTEVVEPMQNPGNEIRIDPVTPQTTLQTPVGTFQCRHIVPVYRWIKRDSSQLHFYTRWSDQNCRAASPEHCGPETVLDLEYRFAGIAFYALGQPYSGTQELYRARSAAGIGHFYSVGRGEFEAALSTTRWIEEANAQIFVIPAGNVPQTGVLQRWRRASRQDDYLLSVGLSANCTATGTCGVEQLRSGDILEGPMHHVFLSDPCRR